jgi:hypothetical protein
VNAEVRLGKHEHTGRADGGELDERVPNDIECASFRNMPHLLFQVVNAFNSTRYGTQYVRVVMFHRFSHLTRL